jgi:hypothetical protein
MKLILAVLLSASLLFLAAPIAQAAVIFSDNFDSYSNADLVGQGSWGSSGTAGPPGYASFDVQSTVVQAGAKAVSVTNNVNGNGFPIRNITASSGTILSSIYGRQTQASALGLYFGTTDAEGDGWYLRFNNDNTFVLIDSTTFANSTTVGGGWSVNTWYKLEVEVDTANDRARGRIDGGTWSSYVSNSSFGTQVSRVQPVIGGNFGGTTYFDTLVVEDSPVVAAPAAEQIIFFE